MRLTRGEDGSQAYRREQTLRRALTACCPHRGDGGRLAAVEPGEPTAIFIDHVVSRTATIGVGYLALMWLLPEILVAYVRVPFYLGGAALLIVVCTALDLLAQDRAHLQGFHRG